LRPSPCCTAATNPSWITSPIPLKKKNRSPSRPSPLPLRCLNAQCRLPKKENTVATIVAMVVDMTGLSPCDSRRFVSPMVMTNASPPTMPNLAISWISTLKRE
jgi:hypothetical protein